MVHGPWSSIYHRAPPYVSRGVFGFLSVSSGESASRQMSCLFSVGKLADSMGSIGFKVSKTTLIEYLGYIEEAFLGKAVSIHSYSVKDQLQYPRKFYLIDNGLYSAASFVKSGDWGRLLENLVFTVLERRYDSIFYWKNTKGYEVDFVLPDLFDRSNEYPLIQVCYSVMDNETLKREIRSLLLAAKEFGVHKALLITRDQWDHLTEQGIEIKLLPFIQWALNME
jgi:hypothetical protein